MEGLQNNDCHVNLAMYEGNGATTLGALFADNPEQLFVPSLKIWLHRLLVPSLMT